MKKHFIVERETVEEPKMIMAFELFQTYSKLEMITVGSELIYMDQKYRVKRIESIFDYNEGVENCIDQDHINIYIEEI